MSASNLLETDLLELILQKTEIPGLGASDDDLFIALHTADPGEGGTQSSSEANYTGYARQSIARQGAQWNIAGANASNANEVLFPQCTGGSSTVTHYSIGRTGGELLFIGSVGAPLAVTNGVQPRFQAGTIQFTVN